MLIPEDRVENPGVIPASWYSAKRSDVDNATRKEYIKKAFELWRAWEDEAKSTYQTAKTELITNGDHQSANFVNDYIKAASTELAQVNYKMLQLSAKDYDLVEIMNEQEALRSRYKMKLK